MKNFIFYITKYMVTGICIISLPAITIAADKHETINQTEASAILKELKHMRSVLERIEKKTGSMAQAVVPAKLKVAQISSVNRPSLGRKDAPVTIVEVSDYQCPFCKRFADNTLAALKKEYIDTGKVRLVFKDMPLPFHKQATKAAQAAHCAGDQGQYWSMHDQLFSNTSRLDEPNLIKHAMILKLDAPAFKACLKSDRHLDAIKKDIVDASKAGLSGTPSFIIGKTTNDLIKGDVVVGAQPISSLRGYIEKHL